MHKLFKTALLIVAMALPATLASADDAKMRLFVNLASGDAQAATKAIMFAHKKAQNNGHAAALWMNVHAIHLARKTAPLDAEGEEAAKIDAIQTALGAFIADGGTVIMCAACSKAAGLTIDDYIDGVQMGNFKLVGSWLFDEDTQTLGW